ncbi:beta-glucosidase family protein [Phenylobacterium aquaticum]|uniref:beta-glucosidase family protein n=1 Tax=Phenylobacterium aquaticum TaxID=1763816 RepID=UPI001F5DD306|nr:beta-glucosidase [Phenylobacterium aquaticum]MCI3131840.1 beta-glucosidase [Phenylobacterium aquaticum]
MTAAQTWLDKSLSPDDRARALIAELTLDEMITLVHGPMPNLMKPEEKPADAGTGAGYIGGVPRLGIPALNETDASLGVTNPRQVRKGDGSTGLPSGLAIASTWDAHLAYEGGAMVGRESRAKGFNVLLGGGANLTRDPRCGRNFEYLSEDPLLTGVLAGEAIKGAQASNIVCTIKHFALNDQETCRHVVDARIDEGALRESDLLAFQIAIERGQPGSVMCAYNRVNGEWCGENDFLLNQVLKGDWNYPGWVMSDWGAVHTTAKAALAGMDQESGYQLDKQVYFGPVLMKEAVEQGEVPFERLTNMVHRILRSLIDKGVFDNPVVPSEPDYEAHGDISQAAAEAGIVLLKNDGVLPLGGGLRKIAVIGAHADVGVLSGGGSSQVIPVGGPALELKVSMGPSSAFSSVTYFPSAPLAAIKARALNATVSYASGEDVAEAAELARGADLAIVFADQWCTEAEDLPTLSLPHDQDALIAAVAAANSKTIVVLETGTPVTMPWLDQVSAVLEAWYSGTRGGEAIGRILFGEVSPSGRLPISFPRSVDDLVRPQIPGMIFGPPEEGKTIPTSFPNVQQHKGKFSVEHPEGADVGYRWYDRAGKTPLFPFGFGLTYTRFAYAGLELAGGETVTASFEVKNTGAVAGVETAQVYARIAGGQRLIGWARVALEPGESRRVSVEADPRLLASYDAGLPGWRVAAGPVEVTVGPDAATVALKGEAVLSARTMKP